MSPKQWGSIIVIEIHTQLVVGWLAGGRNYAISAQLPHSQTGWWRCSTNDTHWKYMWWKYTSNIIRITVILTAWQRRAVYLIISSGWAVNGSLKLSCIVAWVRPSKAWLYSFSTNASHFILSAFTISNHRDASTFDKHFCNINKHFCNIKKHFCNINNVMLRFWCDMNVIGKLDKAVGDARCH